MHPNITLRDSVSLEISDYQFCRRFTLNTSIHASQKTPSLSFNFSALTQAQLNDFFEQFFYHTLHPSYVCPTQSHYSHDMSLAALIFIVIYAAIWSWSRPPSLLSPSGVFWASASAVQLYFFFDANIYPDILFSGVFDSGKSQGVEMVNFFAVSFPPLEKNPWLVIAVPWALVSITAAFVGVSMGIQLRRPRYASSLGSESAKASPKGADDSALLHTDSDASGPPSDSENSKPPLAQVSSDSSALLRTAAMALSCAGAAFPEAATMAVHSLQHAAGACGG